MRCLIADEMHPGIIPMLEQIGFEVSYKPAIQRDEIIDVLRYCNGLIIRSKTAVDEALIKNAQALQFVARAGAGVDQVDVDLLASRKITLLNAPEGNRDAVGEHCLGLLLSMLHKLHAGDRHVRAGLWDRELHRGTELSTRTVGIIGYGNMGSTFARKLSGLGCNILVYDKYKNNISDPFVEQVSLPTLQREADVVSLHVPLTPETRNFIDTDFFAALKNGVLIINSARGEILDHTALIAGLEQGKIGGAALDVLENEKLKTLNKEQKTNFQYFVESEKVILSPHVAGWTNESYIRINEVLVSKIKALL